MKSITIRLPDLLAQQIDQECRERRVSKSNLIRERLSSPAAAPVAESGMLQILEECWNAATPPTARRAPSSKKQKLEEIIRAKKLHR